MTDEIRGENPLDSRPDATEAMAASASEITKQAAWNGPVWSADELVVAIAAFQGSNLGTDWRSHLPDEVVSLWDDLPQAAQLAAFLVAAHYSLQTNQ